MKRFLLFILCLITISCTTTKSMETANPNKGVAQIYNISYKQAFDVALHACEMLSFKMEEQNFDNKFIIVSEGWSTFSAGERIGIYFREIEPNKTEVRVISKHKLKTHIFGPNWERDVQNAIQARLGQLNIVQ